MDFTSAISGNESAGEACRELLDKAIVALDPASVDLVALFTSGHTSDFFRTVVGRLATEFPNAHMIGCTAEGTIGDGEEHERVPSISMLAGSLSGVNVVPFHLEQEAVETSNDWTSAFGVSIEEAPVFLALGDPFSIDIRAFLDGMNEAFPGRPVIGGMASQARRPGENLLLIDGTIQTGGLVGLALTGDIAVVTVVSQGCRPIGQPFVVTKGEGNIVHGLRDLTAMDALREVASHINPSELELIQHGLFLGRAIDEYKSTFQRGDFLIQNVVGGDPESGAIAVAGEVKVGTTVQFHVRDRDSADEDLRRLLGVPETSGNQSEFKGALLFSCNGRGTRMWDEVGHDVRTLREAYPGLPVAGFFAAGELGPVGGRNFIHGFTASIALLRSRS